MQQLTWQRLATVGAITLALALVLTLLMQRAGATPLAVPWTFDVVCLALGALALWFGWQVRQYLLGRRPSLDGLRAARTVVLAQATAYVGVIIAGACAGYAVGLADDWDHDPRRAVIVSALIAAGAAVATMVAGVVAERWCRHGDDGEDEASERTQPEPA